MVTEVGDSDKGSCRGVGSIGDFPPEADVRPASEGAAPIQVIERLGSVADVEDFVGGGGLRALPASVPRAAGYPPQAVFAATHSSLSPGSARFTNRQRPPYTSKP
jgi:hypothetical protein